MARRRRSLSLDMGIVEPKTSLLSSERSFRLGKERIDDEEDDILAREPKKHKQTKGKLEKEKKKEKEKGEGREVVVQEGYRGLINLAFLLLVLTNLRMVVTNLITYGAIFLTYLSLYLSLSVREFDYRYWPGLTTWVSLNVYVVALYLVECLALLPASTEVANNNKKKKKKKRDVPPPSQSPDSPTPSPLSLSASPNFPTSPRFPPALIDALRVTVVISSILFPSISILLFDPSMASSLMVSLWSCVTHLKLWSYAMEHRRYCTLYWRVRASPSSTLSPPLRESEETILSLYPRTLSLSNLYLFIFMPTLVYKLFYPRTLRVRKSFLMWKFLELFSLSFVIWGIAVQYCLPIVQKTPSALKNGDLTYLLERWLKLAVPNLYVWLTGFYVFFHIYLNIWAEITCYADRRFYGSWWNSTTLEGFWRNWNLPVHQWLVQYVYKPCLRNGMGKNLAYLLVFFVSAVFHELIVAVSFRSLKLWAFLAMMSQIPLIALTRPMEGRNVGNILFWLSMALGQAFAVIMYFQYVNG
mmetsp:Transcript_11370/g.31917  ORF Transcript_11370/g.31917 Transcript_11370/m.31917 type:complete len:527 (+) Transcript_11370:61-1641(+)|eukprot:CAMPEP_0119120776 /NCGR_PEP_ID=MMETSP1310-20130426/1682_1 /TAXON_ID=464262 /ORGANISM="Genus nov. species nov., Strain RCC2339" /LENGTH=526 /DNA_ID=CAMNT_0007110281 /DNA_START=65 /DNA_END=1645 /DNA_ORIENTATION=+